MPAPSVSTSRRMPGLAGQRRGGGAVLYDDDRGGSSYEPIGPGDNTQWTPPLVDLDLLRHFDGPDRILIVLSGEAADYAFLDYQVFDAIGVAWTRSTFDDVVDELARAGLVHIEDGDAERWLSITEDGLDRVDVLIAD